MKTCCSMCCLDTQKSMGPDEIHWGVLRGLEDLIAGLLSVIYQWSSGEVMDDWRLENVMPIYKKGYKKGQGTTGLSARPWFHERWWNRSSWTQSPSIGETDGGSVPASTASWKASPTWPISSPFTTGWRAWWMREKLLPRLQQRLWHGFALYSPG